MDDPFSFPSFSVTPITGISGLAQTDPAGLGFFIGGYNPSFPAPVLDPVLQMFPTQPPEPVIDLNPGFNPMTHDFEGLPLPEGVGSFEPYWGFY